MSRLKGREESVRLSCYFQFRPLLFFFWFLADRTNGRAIGTVLRPSVVVFHRRLSVRNVLWLNWILV